MYELFNFFVFMENVILVYIRAFVIFFLILFFLLSVDSLQCKKHVLKIWVNATYARSAIAIGTQSKCWVSAVE